MDFISSETDEDEDVSDVDPEELQKMLEVMSHFYLKIFLMYLPNSIPLGINGLGPNLYE